MATTQQEPPKHYIPRKNVIGDYPLIDNDPHFRRVVGYARPNDWFRAAIWTMAGPTAFWMMEKLSPAYAGRGAFASVFRLTCLMAVCGGFFNLYARSIMRFYGGTENSREVEMDMREMVDKVKKGEPLYGTSTLSPYMQGVAARNSRYSGMFIHVIPWFNFVNHNLHGVDTAKYYQQAERELAAEDAGKTAEK